MEPYVANLNKYQGKNPLSQVTQHVLHLAVASRSEKNCCFSNGLQRANFSGCKKTGCREVYDCLLFYDLIKPLSEHLLGKKYFKK